MFLVLAGYGHPDLQKPGYECQIVIGDLGIPRIVQQVDSKVITSLRWAMQLVYLMVY